MYKQDPGSDMKKPLIISAIVLMTLAIFIIFHNDPPKKSGRDTAGDSKVLQFSDNTEKAGTTSTVNIEHEGDDELGEINRDTYKNPIDTLTFTIDDRAWSYYAYKKFTYVRTSSGIDGFVANFSANISDVTLIKPSTYRHVLSILVPKDVTPGTYDEKSENFIVQYFGDSSGRMYTLNAEHPFSLIITEWGGHGGRAKGTFSGELKAVDSSYTVTLEDGHFDIAIL